MCSGGKPDLKGRLPYQITLALDAGGTFIKGAVIVNGEFLSGSLLKCPSESQGSSSDIIASFTNACLELLDVYTSICGPVHVLDEVRIGFAFPGPFDYEKGIALLQDVDKYDALYRLSVRELLRAAFQEVRAASPSNLADVLAAADIRFGNDAFLFGLGVSALFPSERLICLTLGTGLGSAFIENGQIVKGRDGVPASGMLFAEPYRRGIVDDYFGRRGILGLASERGILTEKSEVADLAEAARSGDAYAQELFHEYGRRMGKMLLPYISAFKPHRVVLGGQISNSFSLWEKDMQQVLGIWSTPIVQHQDGILAVFQGIHQLFDNTIT